MRMTTFLIVLALLPLSAQPPPDLRTRAEATDYGETSSYDDVMRLAKAVVASSPLAQYENFGATEEKREMPLLILSDPPLSTPEAARKLGRPIVFIQERVGQNRRRFRTFKFRTMIDGADAVQADLEHLNEASGPVFKIRDDPRAGFRHRSDRFGLHLELAGLHLP